MLMHRVQREKNGESGIALAALATTTAPVTVSPLLGFFKTIAARMATIATAPAVIGVSLIRWSATLARKSNERLLNAAMCTARSMGRSMCNESGEYTSTQMRENTVARRSSAVGAGVPATVFTATVSGTAFRTCFSQCICEVKLKII